MKINQFRKRLLIIGIIVLLAIALPITVFLVNQQQKTKSGATAATTLSLSPASQNATVGSTVTFDIYVDPSSVNQVSFVKLDLLYDSTKLETTNSSFATVPWPAADGSTFTPNLPLGPDYTTVGKISVSMSIGSSPQNVLKTRTKIATVTFKALASTIAGSPTQISFGKNTQILNVGSSAEAGENILSNSSPGEVIITGALVCPVDHATCSWDPVSGATSYHYKITKDDQAVTSVKEGNTSDTTVSFNSVAGTTYICTVYAVNSCGNGTTGQDTQTCISPTSTPTTAPTATPTTTPTSTPTSTPTPTATPTKAPTSTPTEVVTSTPTNTPTPTTAGAVITSTEVIVTQVVAQSSPVPTLLPTGSNGFTAGALIAGALVIIGGLLLLVL